jgi:hypothetical protein
MNLVPLTKQEIRKKPDFLKRLVLTILLARDAVAAATSIIQSDCQSVSQTNPCQTGLSI